MKLLIPPGDAVCVNMSLAREIGLAEAAVITKLYECIEELGMDRSGHKMVCRTDEELKRLFPWIKKVSELKKIISNLQDKDFIYVSSLTLLDNGSLWYGLNFDKLKTLKSIVILSDEIVHAPPVPRERNIAPAAIKAESHLHQVLFGAILKVCHMDLIPRLYPRDANEVGGVAKNIIKLYPDHEIEPLKLMVLGFDTYWTQTLQMKQSPRPSTIWSKWQQYFEWCKTFNNNEPPEIKKEWL